MRDTIIIEILFSVSVKNFLIRFSSKIEGEIFRTIRIRCIAVWHSLYRIIYGFYGLTLVDTQWIKQENAVLGRILTGDFYRIV